MREVLTKTMARNIFYQPVGLEPRAGMWFTLID